MVYNVETFVQIMSAQVSHGTNLPHEIVQPVPDQGASLQEGKKGGVEVKKAKIIYSALRALLLYDISVVRARKNNNLAMTREADCPIPTNAWLGAFVRFTRVC